MVGSQRIYTGAPASMNERSEVIDELRALRVATVAREGAAR
jgi:hypothetical protein